MQKKTHPAPAKGSAPRQAAKPAQTAKSKKPAPAKKGGSASKAPQNAGLKKVLIAVGLACFVLMCYVLQKNFPTGLHAASQTNRVPEIDAASTVRITEVMSSNGSAIQDDNGVYSDWFEVMNVSNKSVNLYGYKVAKDTSLMLKYFEFPNHTLAPGEAVLVFCTSTVRNNYGYTYHAPFKLSAAGDTLLLFNAQDSVIQSINVPALSSNESYAEVNGQWVVTKEYTPLLANTRENYEQIRGSRKIVESPIMITEFMAKNVSYAPDENGEYLDWIEIYNASNYAISLNGYALSDSEDNLQKWRFPNVSIGAGEYMLIYASGYDRKNVGSNLHTNFSLSTEKEMVILVNASGSVIDMVEYDILKADQSYSRQSDSSWTYLMPPTPGKSNSFNSAALIESQFAAQNASGVFINEVMASTNIANAAGSSDWLELYNRSGRTVDLSGWGISDDPAKPRKWQFPEGTTLASGQYMGILMSGLDKKEGSYYHTNFKISATEGVCMVLSYPDGTIVDRMPLGRQYSNISYGRIEGRSGFYYLTATTPLTKNASIGYESRMNPPAFSVEGGVWADNRPFELTLTAEPGATIYYTLDASTPDPSAVGGKSFTVDPKETDRSGRYQTYVYKEPILISGITVVRAISVKEGQITSLVSTQTYLMGVSHTMDVISLVMDPVDLWDYNKGLYVFGPNALSGHPYGSIDKGANFWMSWEKDGNVELFSVDGSTTLSQGCGVRLHGQYSRVENQKAFKIIARSKYGVNRFYANLFPNRDYTEYQSFLLRNSGQDWKKSHMLDSILTSLTAGSGVMYQDTANAIVYINGEYWGHYYLRERINTYSICQWEGWDESYKDKIDLIKANTSVMKGSGADWLKLKEWYTKNGIETEEKLNYVKQYVDVDNYLKYIAIEMFTGNPDLLNVKKYKCDEIDGKWRYILFDTDWGFYHNTNSVARWLRTGGVGTDYKTDNSLFIALMKNPVCKDQFLTYFAEMLRTTWSTENVVRLIDERYALLEPEIDMHLQRWGISRSTYESEVKKIKTYAQKRPGHLLYYFLHLSETTDKAVQKCFTKSDIQHYFGDLLQTVPLYDSDGKKWEYKP